MHKMLKRKPFPADCESVNEVRGINSARAMLSNGVSRQAAVITLVAALKFAPHEAVRAVEEAHTGVRSSDLAA